jgi:hypothetical protein
LDDVGVWVGLKHKTRLRQDQNSGASGEQHETRKLESAGLPKIAFGVTCGYHCAPNRCSYGTDITKSSHDTSAFNIHPPNLKMTEPMDTDTTAAIATPTIRGGLNFRSFSPIPSERVCRTIANMLDKRSYMVPPDMRNLSPAAFREKFGESPTREALTILWR